MDATRSIIVEFTGLPGSGKSFLAQDLIGALDRSGIAARDGLGPARADQPAALRLPAKVASAAVTLAVHRPVGVLAAIARSGQPPPQLVRRIQNWSVLHRRLVLARRRAGVHVFDQGVVQELHSLSYVGDWRSVLAAAAPGDGRLGPDLLVSVRVAPEVAERRIAGRPPVGSRLDRVPPAERLQWLEREAPVLIAVEDAWLEAHQLAVPTVRIVVDNSSDSTAARIEITTRLLGAVRSVG